MDILYTLMVHPRQRMETGQGGLARQLVGVDARAASHLLSDVGRDVGRLRSLDMEGDCLGPGATGRGAGELAAGHPVGSPASPQNTCGESFRQRGRTPRGSWSRAFPLPCRKNRLLNRLR